MRRLVRIVAIETTQYVYDFTLEELEGIAGLSLRDDLEDDLDALVQAVHETWDTDPYGPRYELQESLERHGEVQGQEWSGTWITDLAQL